MSTIRYFAFPAKLKILLVVLVIGGVSTFANITRPLSSSILTAEDSRELLDKGLYYLNVRQNSDSAQMCLAIVSQRAFDIHTSRDDAALATRALAMQGEIYSIYHGDFTRASVQLLKALELANKYNFKEEKIYILLNLAIQKARDWYVNDMPNCSLAAANEFSSVLDSAIMLNDTRYIDYIGANMAIWCCNDSDVNRVKDRLNKFLKVSSPESWSTRMIEGTLQFAEGSCEEGIETVRKVIPMIKEPNEEVRKQIEATLMQLEGEMLLASGREEEALKTFNALYARLVAANDHQMLFDVNKSLWNYYRKKGNDELARKYELATYREKEHIRKSLWKYEDAENIVRLEKVETEAALLAATKRTQTLVITICVVFSLVLLVILYVLYRKFRQVRENEAILFRKSQDMVRNLASTESNYMGTGGDGSNVGADGSIDKRTLFSRILEIMKTNEEVFSESFNAARLAELAGERQSVISSEIQQETGRGFPALLAEVRIAEACRRITHDSAYANMTIEAIGQSVGYKSRPYFVSIFKKTVGLTPSEYIRKVNIEKEGK